MTAAERIANRLRPVSREDLFSEPELCALLGMSPRTLRPVLRRCPVHTFGSSTRYRYGDVLDKSASAAPVALRVVQDDLEWDD
jgi:hypothetical protein